MKLFLKVILIKDVVQTFKKSAKKKNFLIDTEHLEASIKSKQKELEELIKEKENFKRDFEENDFNFILQVLDGEEEIIQQTENNYMAQNEELYLLEKEEKELIRETNELETEIVYLQSEKKMIKEDLKKVNHSNFLKMISSDKQMLTIRESNRFCNDKYHQPVTLKRTQTESDINKKIRLNKINNEAQDFLGIYADLATSSNFDLDSISNLENNISHIKSGHLFNERELMKCKKSDIQSFIEHVENWIHAFINIKKRNEVRSSNCSSPNYKNNQDIEKIRRQSRRMSRRFSRNISLKKDTPNKVFINGISLI